MGDCGCHLSCHPSILPSRGPRSPLPASHPIPPEISKHTQTWERKVVVGETPGEGHHHPQKTMSIWKEAGAAVCVTLGGGGSPLPSLNLSFSLRKMGIRTPSLSLELSCKKMGNPASSDQSQPRAGGTHAWAPGRIFLWGMEWGGDLGIIISGDEAGWGGLYLHPQFRGRGDMIPPGLPGWGCLSPTPCPSPPSPVPAPPNRGEDLI